jgi:hypothetical protein
MPRMKWLHVIFAPVHPKAAETPRKSPSKVRLACQFHCKAADKEQQKLNK